MSRGAFCQKASQFPRELDRVNIKSITPGIPRPTTAGIEPADPGLAAQASIHHTKPLHTSGEFLGAFIGVYIIIILINYILMQKSWDVAQWWEILIQQSIFHYSYSVAWVVHTYTRTVVCRPGSQRSLHSIKR